MGRDPSLRRVAIYGRVSTEHEAQLSAFENQQAWYEAEVLRHPDWTVVERYYDEGITGTAAQKRPAFMRMRRDARQGKFDLVVTREVCRFARNTVDTLTVTRELKQLGVEVYFIQDNIWTMDGDGELRLTIMATLAQEESRKISERVRAGQKISREKGVLYGTGNILGYDRVDGTYVINPEQAYVVRKIFELYASGLGYQRICGELMRLGCKNAHGKVSWKLERIGRILRNATYMGYIGYNKSHSDGYLTQKRINHRDEDIQYIKGDFEPIVSEQLWWTCAELRKKKSVQQRGPDGKTHKFSRKAPQSIWTSKLRCSCGSSFRRFLWHRNADGSKTYGYECYRQKRNVSACYLEAHGLDASSACQTKSIPFWHIDLMAKTVFQAVWKERREAVLLACEMIRDCMAREENQSHQIRDGLQAQLDRLARKQEGLREMRAMGDISREEFLRDNQKLQEAAEHLKVQIRDLESMQKEPSLPILDLEQIRATLEQWMDLSAPTVPDALIDQFILQVVLVDDDTFNWTLDLSHPSGPFPLKRMTPSEIALALYRREHAQAEASPEEDTLLERYVSQPKELFTFQITAREAKAYCQSIGMRFFEAKWHDKTVIVSI